VRQRAALAVAASLAAFGALAAPAPAAPRLLTGFAEGRYLSADAEERDHAFDRTVDARAAIVRLNAIWRAIAQGEPIDPRDPADPAYDFGRLDAAVGEAAERGLEPLITIYSAPGYAEGPNRPASAPAGTWKPSPQEFGDFAHAVAARYSGGFLGLPRVRYFQAWNEPNLSNYLTPVYSGGQRQSPGHYRAMLNAFFDAVKGVHGDNLVVTAGTAPYGDPPGGNRIRPLSFWRDVLCLKGRKKLKRRKCPTKPRFDILAHHPINTAGGPGRSAIHPDDVSTPDFDSIRRVLRAAERRKRLGTKGRHPLWATEIWWESRPPDGFEGVRVAKHARWLERALFILWKDGARAVINLQLQDQPFDPDSPFGQTATGVFFVDGTPKPAFTAFRFPFVTTRAGTRHLRAWGRAPAAGKLVIERKRDKGWRRVKSLRVGVGSVFRPRLNLRGKQRLRARVAGQRSLVWRQG
jgi:hypothetical protein